jgi:signal transduction histidine kinase
LLVEDSEDDALLLCRELEHNGYAVEMRRVWTAAEMERALGERRWDVICSDYHMPSFDTLKALAVRGRVAPDTPLLVVSGNIGETAAVALLKAGAADYIPKQNLSRLAPAIRREVHEAGERRARRRAEEERARLVTELAAALRVRDDFLSIASHELRTPLTALRLYLQSIDRLEEQGRRQRVHDKVAAAERQLGRLEALIADMVSVSLVRPGELRLEREEVDLSGLVELVAARFRREEAETPLTIRAPERLVGRWDKAHLEEVVRRLLSNAFKYGAAKPVEVRLAQDGGAAVLAVADHGIGISAGDQERIFDRFGRAVPVANYGGFGLGLWIARNIVEAHAGTLTVDSTPGEGSTFTVRLPLSPAQAS